MKSGFKIKNATAAFSLIQMLYWMSPGLIGGYVSIYLLDQNYTNTQIGFIIAIAGIMSALFQPVVATYADKPKAPSLKIILSLAMAVFIALVFGLILTYDRAHALTGILFCVCMLMRSFIMPLINSLGTETMNQGAKINYGFARGMGSVAYAAISFVLGKIISVCGVHVVNYAFILFGVIFIIAMALYPFEKNAESKKVSKEREASNPLKFIVKYKSLGIVLIGTTLLYICQGQLHNYFYQEIESVGGGSAELGIGMAITALFELPAMFGLGFLLKHIKAGKLVLISGLFYALKAFLIYVATDVAGFYVAQIFQVGSFALLTVSSVMFVNFVVEEADAIKGQAYMSITYTIGAVIGAATGGVFIDLGGVRMMLVTTMAAALIGSLIIAIGLRVGNRP